MAAYYPYVLVEREVHGLLNSLRSNDVADAEANVAFTGQLDATQVDDAAYPPWLVRRVILTVQNLIATAIINTVGHARRVDFAVTFLVTHLTEIPTGIGPIGGVYDAATKRAYVQRSVDEINHLRANPIQLPAGVTPPTFFYFGLDGGLIYLPDDGQEASVEVFRFTDPADTIEDVGDLFADETTKTVIGPEFIPALNYGSVSILAGKAGGNLEQGGFYGRLFDSVMMQQGIPRKIKLDYADKPAKEQP